MGVVSLIVCYSESEMAKQLALRSGPEVGSQIHVASNGVSSGASLMTPSVVFIDDDSIIKIQDTRRIKLKQRMEETKISDETRKEIAQKLSDQYKRNKYLWSKF